MFKFCNEDLWHEHCKQLRQIHSLHKQWPSAPSGFISRTQRRKGGILKLRILCETKVLRIKMMIVVDFAAKCLKRPLNKTVHYLKAFSHKAQIGNSWRIGEQIAVRFHATDLLLNFLFVSGMNRPQKRGKWIRRHHGRASFPLISASFISVLCDLFWLSQTQTCEKAPGTPPPHGHMGYRVHKNFSMKSIAGVKTLTLQFALECLDSSIVNYLRE